jgi:hypothetical protein
MDEAVKPLGQLDWIVHRVARLEDRDKRAWQRGWKPDPRRDTVEQHARYAARQRALGDEIELPSESFYYFAWRFREILYNNLPGFTKRFDPKGVRAVRNDLLEHPKHTIPSFVYGAQRPFGPVLKPFGERQGAPQDSTSTPRSFSTRSC